MKAKKVGEKTRATAKSSAKPKQRKAKAAASPQPKGGAKTKATTSKRRVVDARTTRMGSPILFATDSRQADDVQTLARIARTLAVGGGADGHSTMLYGRIERACLAAIDALRRHEVPACFVDVAAATTVVALPKDYAVRGFRERAATLLLERPECAATAHRVAVLGGGLQARVGFGEARPALFGLEGEAHADALLAAMDVIGAGCHHAVKRLVALADANPATPSIVWLAEVAARTTGDTARQRKMRRTLDELLDSDAFGDGTREAASFVPAGRERLDATTRTLGETWHALSMLKRGSLSIDLGPVVAAARDKDDANVREKALFEEIQRTEAEIAETERRWREAYGPFYGLSVPAKIGRALDEPAHYAITGFRQLYGLEILRETMPELASLAKVGRAEPN